MSAQIGLDLVTAYRVGNHYTFEAPAAPEADLGLVAVRLAPGAWLQRTDAGETVVCAQRYRFGARLMAAISLGLCTVEPLHLEELYSRSRPRRARRASRGG
jgi:hypothetical protein